MVHGEVVGLKNGELLPTPRAPTKQYNTIQYNIKTYNAPYVTRMLIVGAGMLIVGLF